MTPINSRNDFPDGISANAEFFGERRLPFSFFGSQTDLFYFPIVEFCSFVFLSMKSSAFVFKYMARMQHVKTSSYILQILKASIGLYSVFVINFISWWRKAKENKCYKDVDSKNLNFSSIAEIYLRIATGIKNRFKYFTFRRIAWKAAHLSRFVDFIKSFVIFNRLPFHVPIIAQESAYVTL